jgi:predicted nucleic acid-binding protein
LCRYLCLEGLAVIYLRTYAHLLILIDVSRNADKSINYLELLEKSHSLAISSITQMELIVACRNKQELSVLDRFLKRFQIIDLNSAK